jgi:hypothetical protein
MQWLERLVILSGVFVAVLPGFIVSDWIPWTAIPFCLTMGIMGGLLIGTGVIAQLDRAMHSR